MTTKKPANGEKEGNNIDFNIYNDYDEGRFKTKCYDMRDDYNFPIMNFPFIYSNVPEAFTYGIYLSQLMQ